MNWVNSKQHGCKKTGTLLDKHIAHSATVKINIKIKTTTPDTCKRNDSNTLNQKISLQQMFYRKALYYKPNCSPEMECPNNQIVMVYG